MFGLPVCGLLIGLLLVMTAGCRRQKENVPAPAPVVNTAPPEGVKPAEQPPPAPVPDATVRQTLASVETSLKSGNYDQAAANLLKARIAASNFSPEEAAAYRKAMADAYSQAVEAAAKGDPRGKAAMQMIRAAGPR